jgi:hypothetical protein
MSDPAPSLPSLSQRLMEMAGAELNQATDEREYLAKLHLVIAAWNLAVVPGHPKITQRFDNAVLHAPVEVRRAAEAHVAELVSLKKRLFPDDTRVIVDARLRRHESGISFETKSYDYTVHGDKGL